MSDVGVESSYFCDATTTNRDTRRRHDARQEVSLRLPPRPEPELLSFVREEFSLNEPERQREAP